MASDVQIQSIVFNPGGGFDIAYAEERDISPNVVVLRQAMVIPGLLEDKAEEVREAIQELLDAALEKQHEVPDRIRRK